MRSRRRALVLGIACLVLLGVGGGTAASQTGPDLFFSEYVEGSSNNKALEIYNETSEVVDLAAQSYSVQMFFNGSTTAGLTINLAGSVAPGQVFVLAHSSADPAILAQADQMNGAGWFNGDDAVVLRKGTTVIDAIGQIGVDPGTEWGAGLTSTADNTLRRMPTIVEGDPDGTNAFDPALEWEGFATNTFDGLGTHFVGEGDAPPAVSATVPAGGSFDVAVAANVAIDFTEDVTTSGTWFTIACDDSGAHAAAASGSGASYTLDPAADFAHGETCTVTVLAAQVADADDPADTMTADYSFSFTTIGLPATITQIQGVSHLSPLAGEPVSGVEGVVTARRIAGGRGVWIQDPAGDGNHATSDGLFVFTGATPTAQIGDRVRVRGTVTEFRGGCADPCTPAAGSGFNNLTITQITTSNAGVEVLSSGNAVPAPTVLGFGGRMPPTRTIDDDSATTRDIEVSNDFDPWDDAIDFYESLEGMLVQVNDGAVVGPTKSFGEITLLPDAGMWATGLRTPRGGILYRYKDGNPERIAVDDEILRDLIVPRPGNAMPSMDVGARLTSPVVGPVDYTFANYKIQAMSTPTFLASPIARETARPARRDELSVATFNVENLTVGNPQSKFDELAGMIVDNLRAPDLIGIEEVQDDSGASNNGVVAAAQTWQKLIDAIAAAGGPAYQYRQIDPVNNEDGGAPGANIRVGFLFRTDSGLSFVDRPGGDSTTPTAVVRESDRGRGRTTPRLTLSPGRIDPANPAYVETRKSLAGEFRWRGETLFAVVVHFSSKGGDQPLFGRFQPPTRFTELERHGQAQAVNDFVDEILDIDRKANVVVLGDVNDFDFSETVDILEGRRNALTTFMGELRRSQRYSYVFEGNSQTLDQILGSDAVLDRLVEYDVVHVNAEFAEQASDHDPSVARIELTGRHGHGHGHDDHHRKRHDEED